MCNIPRLILSFTFVNPPCVCDRGDSSCSNKGKFDDDDDDDDVNSTNPGQSNLVFRSKPIAEAEMSNWPIAWNQPTVSVASNQIAWMF